MRDQTILVTGGTGTFGTAFVRYALAHGARRVIAVSNCGHKIAALLEVIGDPRLECWTGNVRDRERMGEVMRVKPDVVIHAAAIKRVEQCEANPEEAKKTNVDGTLNVIKAALEANVPRVLVISSDKACSPETVYGATKAEAEQQAIARNGLRGDRQTRISVVRYGNILGSAGSFLDRIYRSRLTGEPLPITDVACTRYWWAIEDAVAFVGSVLEQMQGAEIFVPKLASARVIDLVKAIAPDAPIQIVGTRGPEKIHEAMINATEAPYTYALPDRYVILPKQGQWWSPEAPQGAIAVPVGFAYTSNDDPLPVHLEALEEALRA